MAVVDCFSDLFNIIFIKTISSQRSIIFPRSHAPVWECLSLVESEEEVDFHRKALRSTASTRAALDIGSIQIC